MASGEVAGRVGRHLIARMVEQAGMRRAVWSVKRTARASVRDAERAVLEHAARRGETRGPDEILEAMTHETTARLSDADRAEIRAFADRAAAAEKSLTPRIKAIGAGHLKGLPNRLKSEGSLTARSPRKWPLMISRRQRRLPRSTTPSATRCSCRRASTRQQRPRRSAA